ncbi:MAG: hypothetical protein IKA59_03145, partial [Clostridia bacterium]|nr:hypothetical protein [Clostridia bacterium]
MKLKQNAIKIARVALIATIFILAFAIIIAAPVESSTEIALAGVNSPSGTAKGIYGKSGELTADNFAGGFPGSGLNKTTWTHTESLSGIVLDSSNVSACLYNTEKPLRLEAAGSNGFRFGMTEHEDRTDMDGWKAYAVVNYQISPFLKNLISNTNATVQVTGASLGFARLQGNSSMAKVMVSSSAVSASSIAGDTDSGYTSTSSTDDTTLKPSISATLESSHNVIAFAFAIVGGWWGTGGDYKPTGHVHDISITFKVTLDNVDYSETVINDGEAPTIWAIDSKSPFRTDNKTGSNWNYYPSDMTQSIADEIAKLYNQNLDRVDANNNIYLHSYVNGDPNGPDAQTIDGKTYFKSVVETFADQYSYGSSTVKVADLPGKQYYGGIKTIQVGGTTFKLWEDNVIPHGATGNTNSYTGFQAISVEGVQVGWARVKAIHRSKMQVEMYFSTNADLNIIVTDYGEKQIAKSISIKGIDSQANSEMESVLDEYKDYFMNPADFVDAGSWDNIKWNYNPILSFEFNEDSVEREGGQSPYMWFYSVVKANTPSALTSANWSRETLLTKMPFALNGLNFTYDFRTGLANSKLGGQGDTDATGSGYYLFTFYKMTLSGRFDESTGVRSYYVKVDYEEAVHTLNKTAKGLDLDNLDWAAGAPLVVTLTQDKPNIAGNTLSFITLGDGDVETVQNVYVNNGLIYVLDAEGNPKYENGSRVTLHSGARTVYVDYEIDAEGRAVWTVTFATISTNEQGRDIYVNYNYISTFEITIGVEVDNENPVSYVDNGEKIVTDGVEHYKWQYLQGGKYRSGVYIRVDRNAPLAPNFMNGDDLEEEYIVEMSDFQIPAITERVWYTDSWTFPGQFDFSDDLVAEFGDEIKVYYAMKNIVTADDFTASGERLSIAQFISDYEGDGYGHLSTYAFDMYESVGGSKLEDLNALNLALDSKLGAGMRVVFFWTVDQAGNKSDLFKYYILADANTYYLTGRIDNGIFVDQTDVTIVSGNAMTAYKRGQSAVVEYEISEDSAYVPYKFTIDNGGEERATIWTNDNPTSSSVSYDQAPVAIDGTTLTLLVDDNSLGKLQTQDGEALDVYFSFREYVQISVLNNSVYYAGAPTSVPFTISNENAKQYIEYNFEGFATNERPVNVGEYTFTMHIDTESYITDAPESMDYFINKKALSISINNSTGVYGDEQTFGYTVDGLVGADLEAWDPETYTFSNGLSLPNANDWILFEGQGVAGVDFTTVDVGIYRLSFYLAVSTGELSANYTIPTLTEARHTITQRELVVSVVSGGKVYGDADGEIQFTIDTATLPSGITATNIGDIIKNAYTVGITVDQITLTGDGLITREMGEDAGEYKYNSDATAFDTSANYKVVVDTDGKVFTITKRTVVVTPNSGQEFAYSEENDYNIVYTLDDYRFAEALVIEWLL